MKLYGIIGYPVKHTLSPAMHNAAFKALKINAAYKAFEVKPKDLRKAIKDLVSAGVCGFNVTIPHKTACMKYLDKIDKAAKATGAVNTVNVKNGELLGYNTDGPGFLRSLKEDLGVNPEGKNFFVIGAGGAAKAAVASLVAGLAGSVTIVDKITSRAVDLADNRIVNYIEYKQNWEPFIDEADVLINASPVGMKNSDPAPIDTRLLHKGLSVFDLVYNRETELIKAAKKKGIRVCGGIGMLLYQGVLAFEIWTAKKAPLDVMRKALIRSLRGAPHSLRSV